MSDDTATPKLLLIVNADDLGYSAERDRGIIEAVRRGVVTSATLLVNGVNAAGAVTMSKEAGLIIGLHLNLTEGMCVAKTPYKTLTDENGKFLEDGGLREKISAGAIDLEEVRVEICHQIDRFLSLTGYKPFHVDGHQHCHLLPGIPDVFASTLSKYGIQMARLDIETIKLDTCSWFDESTLWPLTKVIAMQSRNTQSAFVKHGVRFTDCFLGLGLMGAEMTLDRIKSSLTTIYGLSSTGNHDNASSCKLDESRESSSHDVEACDPAPRSISCEFMVHPGFKTTKDGGCGTGADWFSESEEREHELALLCSDQLKTFLKENNIQLLNFALWAKLC